MIERTDTPSPRRTSWRSATALAALLAVALVIGCAQTPPPTGDPDPDPDPVVTVLRGSVVYPVSKLSAPEPLLAVSLLMIDIAFEDGGMIKEAAALGTAESSLDVDPTAVTPSTFVDIGDNAYLAGVTSIEADGSFELVLPDGDTIPDPLFRAAQDAIVLGGYVADADCTITASAPDARVTATFWQFLSSATPAFFSPSGLNIAYTVTEAFAVDTDPAMDTLVFVTLAYATEATTLTATGTECASEGGPVITIDAPLVAGWNQLTWVFDDDGVTIGVRPIDETVFSVVIGGS